MNFKCILHSITFILICWISIANSNEYDNRFYCVRSYNALGGSDFNNQLVQLSKEAASLINTANKQSGNNVPEIEITYIYNLGKYVFHCFDREGLFFDKQVPITDVYNRLPFMREAAPNTQFGESQWNVPDVKEEHLVKVKTPDIKNEESTDKHTTSHRDYFIEKLGLGSDSGSGLGADVDFGLDADSGSGSGVMFDAEQSMEELIESEDLNDYTNEKNIDFDSSGFAEPIDAIEDDEVSRMTLTKLVTSSRSSVSNHILRYKIISRSADHIEFEVGNTLNIKIPEFTLFKWQSILNWTNNYTLEKWASPSQKKKLETLQPTVKLDFIPEEQKDIQFIDGLPVGNKFIYSMIQAHNNNLSVIISPDMMQTVLIQNIEHIINVDPLDYPSQINRYNRNSLQTLDYSMVRGDSKINFYHDIIHLLSEKVKLRYPDIEELQDLGDAQFSTTTKLMNKAHIISSSTWSDMYRSCDEVSSKTGIHSFKLVGKQSDWDGLLRLLNKFSKWRGKVFESWFIPFKSIIENMVESRSGNINYDFWKNFVHFEVDATSGTTQTPVNGHITKLYAFSEITYKNGRSYTSFHEGQSRVMAVVSDQIADVWSGFMDVTVEDGSYLKALLSFYGSSSWDFEAGKNKHAHSLMDDTQYSGLAAQKSLKRVPSLMDDTPYSSLATQKSLPTTMLMALMFVMTRYVRVP